MAYLVAMRDDRYRPADIAEVEQKVSLLNEPVHDEVIELRPGQSAASLHALLVGVRNQGRRCSTDWRREASTCLGRGKGKW